VIGVAASYAPVEVPQLALQQAESTLPLDDILDEIMASAEYHTVIEASGRLGLLKNPKVLLRELRIRTRDLLKREDARRFLEAAEGTAGIAVSTNAGIQLPSFLNAGAGKGGFAPPFLSSWASFAQVAGAAVRPLREANMSASEIYFRSNNPFNLNNRYYPISPAPGITDVDFQTQVEVARRVKVRAAAFA
jgi:hypothetical protein